MSAGPVVILASSSPYRCELLKRLKIPFSTINPDVDESPLPNELVEDLVVRLARSKAMAAMERSCHAKTAVIGSDQVAVLDSAILTKPGDHAGAIDQLQRSSGREVVFYTSLAVFISGNPVPVHEDVVKTIIRFRELSNAQIENYLNAERPYDCAGSFKVEGLGICLFESVTSDDPTALVGLPLISLCGALNRMGIFAVGP